MDNNVMELSLDEALKIISNDKERIKELEMIIKNKEEENKKLKKVIEELKDNTRSKEEYEECAFDGLFETYDYFNNEK